MSNPKVPTVRPRDTRRTGPRYNKEGEGLKTPRKWTAEEDDLLRTAVQEIGAKHWKLVAERVPGRNHVQCLQRYLRVLQPGLKKGHWTAEEDEKLRNLATKGFTSWTEAAEQIPGRSAKQCRDRWRNHLESSIKHGPWEPEEDALLLQLHEKQGNRWAAIARLIPGRTENAVKIHCKALLAKKEEDSSHYLADYQQNSFEIASDGEHHSSHAAAQAHLHQQQHHQHQLHLQQQQQLHHHQQQLYHDELAHYGYGKKDDVDDDEVTDDFSSISPLPSPLAIHPQWFRPWSSPTGATAANRSNQFYQQNPGVLRTSRLQSFPPPIVGGAAIVDRRRSSRASLPPVPLNVAAAAAASSSQQQHHHQQQQQQQHHHQQQQQHHQQQQQQNTTSPSNNMPRGRLFPPINTSFDSYNNPSFSPSNAGFSISPTNAYAGSNPMSFRLEMPSIIRPSPPEEAAGQQQEHNFEY